MSKKYPAQSSDEAKKHVPRWFRRGALHRSGVVKLYHKFRRAVRRNPKAVARRLAVLQQSPKR
jgi:hypothetical protein